MLEESFESVNCVPDTNYIEYFHDAGIMGQTFVTFANKPTAESKFLYIYDLLKTHDRLPSILLNLHQKSNSKSRKLRDIGNVHFQNKLYSDALLEYNFSVMNAVVGSEDYALALANRSAAFYHLEKYDASICDIHLALATKYPKEKAYKLYEREVKCLGKLGRISQAKFKFKEFVSHLPLAVSTIEKKKDIEENLRLFLNKFNKEKKSDDEDKKIIIKLLGGQNKNIPALSKFIKLTYSETMGRCLVVTSHINPGDVLAIEKSYAGELTLGSFYINCHYCFKRCFSSIPCLRCTQAIYCDETCRSKSLECGHKYDCKIISSYLMRPNLGATYLTVMIFLKSVYKLGLDKYVATVRSLNADTTDPMMRGFNADGKYLSDQFNSVYTLEGNEAKRTISDLFTRYCNAATMISLFKLAGFEIPDHQLGTVGESLVHIMCVVSSNAHEIDQKVDNCNIYSISKITNTLPVGNVLMPVLSLLNHHCDPNVVRHNYNGTVVLRAIKPIDKDSQLFDNYGNLFAVQIKETRQLNLNNQYHFRCQCKPCEENWPTYDILVKQPISERLMLTNINLDIVRKEQGKLFNIISKMKMKQYDVNYLPFLYSHLSFLHKNIKTPCREYCECQEAIKEILCMTADKFIAIDN